MNKSWNFLIKCILEINLITLKMNKKNKNAFKNGEKHL